MSVTTTKRSKSYNEKISPQQVESKHKTVVNKYRKLDLEKELNVSSSSDEESPTISRKQLKKRSRSKSCSSESTDSETICSPEIKVGSAVVYMLSKGDKTPKIIKKSINNLFEKLD